MENDDVFRHDAFHRGAFPCDVYLYAYPHGAHPRGAYPRGAYPRGVYLYGAFYAYLLQLN